MVMCINIRDMLIQAQQKDYYVVRNLEWLISLNSIIIMYERGE